MAGQGEMGGGERGPAGIGRRGVLRAGAMVAGAVAAVGALGWSFLRAREDGGQEGLRLQGWSSAGADTLASSRRFEHRPFLAGTLPPEPLDDTLFDPAAVEAGAWVPGPYGAGDQRGSFNEVTPQKTAEALTILDTGRPVVTYQLGSLVFNDFPSLQLPWPRVYQQRLKVFGHRVPANTDVILAGADPAGVNRLSAHEEEFPNGFSYHIGNLMGSLNHIGVGDMFYNGFKGSEMARSWGTSALGTENMGPILTRGILLDILDLKVSAGETGAFFTASNGAKVLKETYRITVEDIEAALARSGTKEIRPGDVVFLRTGWTRLIETDPQRFLSGEPGPFLRETRYLCQRRPAIVGSDNWAVEWLDESVTKTMVFPCHQIFFVRHGIRIQENVVLEDLAEEGVFEFVYFLTPTYAQGATTSNSPPAALGQPRPRP